MRLVLIILIFLVACDTADNVEPRFEQVFVKYYGEAGSQSGADVKATSDGGFVIPGTTDPNTSIPGDKDVVVYRTDELGNELWMRRFSVPFDNEAVSMVIDAQDNIVLASNRLEADGTSNIFIRRLDANGTPLDSLEIGDPLTNETANMLTAVSDGGYAVIGTTDNITLNKYDLGENVDPDDLTDIIVVRIDPTLIVDPNWQIPPVFGFPGSDRGIGIAEADNPFGLINFMIFATSDKLISSDPRNDNLIFYKVNQFGAQLTEPESLGADDEEAANLLRLDDGGFLLLGNSTVGNDTNLYLTRLDRDGNISVDLGTISDPFIQNRIMGGAATQAQGGGFIITGELIQNNQSDIIVLQSSTTGTVQWSEVFGNDSDDDQSGSVLQLPDGSIIITGTIRLENQDKICLIKANARGRLE